MNITCFDSSFQQPILLVRHSSNTPIIPPSLHQISYVETFRLLGYQFQVLLKPFAFMIDQHFPAEVTKEMFVEWFNQMKQQRVVNRVRQCSKEEIKLRTLFIQSKHV